MPVLTKYILGQTLRHFFVTIAATLTLLTFAGAAKEGVRQGLPPLLVLKTIPFVVPEMLRFTLPAALLFSVCVVFGRMNRDNEIVAVKSAGINPLRIVIPVLVLAFLLGIVTFGIYEVCAVWARPNMQRLVRTSIDDIAYQMLQAEGKFTSEDLSISVSDVREQRLLNPHIIVQEKADRPRMELTAAEARLVSGVDGHVSFQCRDGRLQIDGQGSLSFADTFEHTVEIGSAKARNEDHLSPASLGAAAVERQIARESDAIRLLHHFDASEISDPDAKDRRLRQLAFREARLFRLQAEIPRRMANGFGCFCFALIGIPVAMWSRSSDFFSVFFICFLPILVVYYPLLVVGESLACEGVLPGLSVWIADGLLLVVGATLLKRQIRH